MAVKLLKYLGVYAIVPMSKSAMYAEIRRNGFPPPIQVSSATGKNAAVAWIESEVLDYVQRKIDAGRALRPYTPPPAPTKSDPSALVDDFPSEVK